MRTLLSNIILGLVSVLISTAIVLAFGIHEVTAQHTTEIYTGTVQLTPGIFGEPMISD